MEFISIPDAKRKTGLSYLGRVNSSAKINKNMKVGQMTYALYLAPSNTSGYNTCPNATDECKMGCLNTSGRVKMDIYNMILPARIKKTKLFFEHNKFFMDWLIAELNQAKNRAIKKGYQFSARLNCTSDIDWQKTGVFDLFPDVTFYDYTKNPVKFNNIAPNYNLTFSYTGYNWNIAHRLLNKGFNIAVVFNIKANEQLPVLFNGYRVVSGDITDFRPNDDQGVIIGLHWKNIANRKHNEIVKNSKFVVQQTDPNVMFNTDKIKVAV